MPQFKPYVPKNAGEIIDLLGFMMLYSPTFVRKNTYFPDDNMDSTFLMLNDGLQAVRGKLGEERYQRLREMSDRMRAHFEADPENKTDDTLKGRAIIDEMQGLLRQRSRKS